MIITTIKLHGKTTKKKEIIQTIKGLTSRTAKDGKCLKADLYQDLENEDTLYFMEEWESQEAWENYMQSKDWAVLMGLELLLTDSLEIKHAVKM